MRLASAVVVAIALGGCGSLTSFDVPLSQTGVLKGAFSSIPTNGFAPDDAAGADASQEIANQGVKASDIKSATFTAGSISVTSPAGGDLHYLSGLELYVESPGVAKKRFAHVDTFAAGQSSYPFALDGLEMKPYLAASSMTISTDVKQTSRPNQDEQLRIDLTLHVQL